MTTDPLDLLRASNPVPDGSSAPPIERVLERISAEGPARRRWRGWTGAFVPALGAAAAVAVAAVALVLAGVDHRSSVRHHLPAASTVPSAPRGGMRGLVFLQGAAFAFPSDGLISLQQCLGYRDGDPTAHTSCRDWIAATTDMGVSWRFARREYVFNPRFSGADGWAEGLKARSDTGGGFARFFVTHDGGRTWSVAPSAASALGPGQDVSVGGDEVWAVGSDCSASAQCPVTILHGPVTGSGLEATAAQPVGGSWTNVEVVAAGPQTAYVLNPDHAQQTFVTHDDGRSWQRIQSACPATALEFGRLASGGSPGSVWVSCQPWHGATTLRRSVDGGRGWQALPAHFGNVFRLEPVSAQVAWGVTPGGVVVRTTDGGFAWSTVWSAARSQPTALRSRPPRLVAAASATPTLTVQSASSASVVMIVTRGLVSGQARFTNLVVYRTTDGGATWNPSVVPLPER
jgi:hypothetical protein